MSLQLQDDFGSGTYALKDGQISPNKQWKCQYAGYGSAGVSKISTPKNNENLGTGNYCMVLQPQKNDAFTSASFVTSEKTFKDFDVTFYMRTVEQLKTKPENWETAWFMFRYTDNTHHYYFYIGRNGTVEIGKKDYVKVGTTQIKTPDGKVTTTNNQDQQVFLNTAGKVTFSLNRWYKIRVICKAYNIKLYIDDKLIADVTDNGTTGNWLGKPVNFKPSSQMLAGKVGFYVEDAKGEFDNISVK